MSSARFLFIARLVAVVSCLLFSAQVHAQVTVATVRGKVVGEDGGSIAEAAVTLINTATGASKGAVTDTDGEFAFTGLDIGGPYKLSAEVSGFQTAVVKDIMLSAGRTREFTLTMKLQEEVIEVSGNAVTRQTSNRMVITSEDIEEMPSASQDPKDLARMTPDAVVQGSEMFIAGVNNRFNSITVDGIRENDDFGLSASGYPSSQSPIPLNAIQEMTVESAPFDVRYSKFMGGNVNIITKSGTNDFHGNLFVTYASDALEGTQIGENTLTKSAFDEVRYGGELQGPIIKDKMHFMLTVSGLSATTPVPDGPAGSTALNITKDVTQAEMQQAQQIAQQVYGFSAGTPNQSSTESMLNVLAKTDYEISNTQRLVFSYQRQTDDSIVPTSSSNTTLALSSNWYDEKDTLNAFTARLYSDWSDKLSTQFVINAKTVSNLPRSLDGENFMAVTIYTPEGGQIKLGPDDYRQTNLLYNNDYHGQFEVNYLAGRHLITGGVEYELLHIKNDFVPDSTGGDVKYESLADFMSKTPSQITYSNAVTLNPADAEADWDAGTLSAYLQDQVKVTDLLNITGGLRLESYNTNNQVTPNPYFYQRYNFWNTSTLNGRSIVMPRVGATYLAADNLNLRGGFGLYSGGSPNVWMSNSYSNNGINESTVVSTNASVINGYNGINIPQGILSQIKAGNGEVAAVDPNFKLPSQWKVGGGADWAFMHGASLKLNYTFSRTDEAVTWENLRRCSSDIIADDVNPYYCGLASSKNERPVGFTVDGRPEYGSYFNTREPYDILMTNTNQGWGHVLTATLEKAWSFGLNLRGTYAFERVFNGNPGTSSIAASNYGYIDVAEPNSPPVALSQFAQSDRFTVVAQYSHAWIGDLTDSTPWKFMKTGVGLFFESISGAPYSWTFQDANFGKTLGSIFGEPTSFAGNDRELFYVPNGSGNDVQLSGITQQQMQAFLQQTGLAKYAGRIAPANGFSSPAYNHADVRLSQDIPNPFHGHRARVTFDIQDVGNLIDHNWGRLQYVPYNQAPAVNVAVDPATNKYIYSNLQPSNPNSTNLLSSVWRISLGLMYDF